MGGKVVELFSCAVCGCGCGVGAGVGAWVCVSVLCVRAGGRDGGRVL